MERTGGGEDRNLGSIEVERTGGGERMICRGPDVEKT